MKDWTDEERKLFEESRRLKEKARGLVAKRHAAAAQANYWREEALKRSRQMEREKAERDRKAAELAEKNERDARIRRAVLDFAAIAKRNNLAFKAPNLGCVEHAFTLIDKGASGTGYRSVRVNTTPDGFQWN